MIRRLLPLTLPVALIGCGNGYAEVFIVEVGTAVEGEPTETIEHNFNNAAPPVDDTTSEWTTTLIEEQSSLLSMAQIFEADGGEEAEVIMYAAGQIFPGLKVDGKQYQFTWTNYENYDETEAHTSGYSYAQTQDAAVTWTFNVDLKENTGTFDLQFDQVRTYAENDLWDATATDISFGQIPAEAYLDSTTEGGFVFNASTTTECSGTPCTISASGTGTASAPITLWPTNVEPGTFDGLQDAEQQAGLGDNGPT